MKLVKLIGIYAAAAMLLALSACGQPDTLLGTEPLGSAAAVAPSAPMPEPSASTVADNVGRSPTPTSVDVTSSYPSAGRIGVASAYPVPSMKPVVVAPSPLSEQRLVLRDNLYIASVSTKTEDAARKVTYAATFPKLEGAVDGAAAQFNAQVDALVQRELDAFRTGIAQYLRDIPQPSDSLGSSIAIGYKLLSATPELISVLFEEMTYTAGAAHPNHVTFVLNYDLANGRSLALADLFKPEAAYLDSLSAYCTARLQERDIAASVDGAAPTLENYKSWNIQPEGLRITFDPYQVASYAAGPQTIVVPYAELRAIINPVGPLATFIR